jgi:diguanylate cyclase (GGDEF)-like protein
MQNLTDTNALAGPTSDRLTWDRVRGDRLALLYQQSPQAAIVSLLVACLVGVTFWSDGDHTRIAAWLGLVALSSAVRMVLFASYYSRQPDSAAILAWEKPYLVTLLVSSLIWGVGIVWAVPRDSLLHEAIGFGFLMGMAGGALSVYSAIRMLALATITAILLPLALWMVLEGGAIRYSMAFAALLYFLSAWRATRVLSSSLQQNFEKTYALHDAKEAAERLASTDALTGLSNRRAFFEHAAITFHYCRRNRKPVAAMLIDIDQFKRINDTRGHAVGDLALQHVAQMLRGVLRKSDLCCRLGGEEFAVLLPDTKLADASHVAEKLRAAIADQPLPLPGANMPLSITVSVGVAEGCSELEALLERADSAMYAAKNAGRNRVATPQETSATV